jgi:hypothetical protein
MASRDAVGSIGAERVAARSANVADGGVQILDQLLAGPRAVRDGRVCAAGGILEHGQTQPPGSSVKTGQLKCRTTA